MQIFIGYKILLIPCLNFEDLAKPFDPHLSSHSIPLYYLIHTKPLLYKKLDLFLLAIY